jgi:hypothetical protein
MSGYTIGQQMTLALIPRLTSTIGISCSILLISELIRDYRKNEMNPIKRALAFITCYEVCGAFGWWLSTWALPSHVDYIWSTGSWASCNFQGFIIQICIGAPLSQTALTCMFYMICKGIWTDTDFHSFERIAYSTIFIITFGTGFMFLALEQFNPASQVCWVTGYPFGCNEATFGLTDGEPCERGFNSNWFAIFGYYLFLWCALIIIIVLNMLMRRMLVQNDLSTEAKWVTSQALLFSLAFVVTWTPTTLWSFSTWFNIYGYWLDLLTAIFEPLQGFWNLLIFVRNRPDSIERIRLIFCGKCTNNTSTTTTPKESNIDIDDYDYGITADGKSRIDIPNEIGEFEPTSFSST